MKLDEKTLARLLEDAKKAHGKYEETLGHRDKNWPRWYAARIIRQLEHKNI